VAGHGENCLVEPLLSGDSEGLSSPRNDDRRSRVNERVDFKIKKNKKRSLATHATKKKYKMAIQVSRAK